MNIRFAVKGVNHILVVCNIRKNTQFNLRIVGINKGHTVLGNKEFSHLSAKFCSYGNILKIRLNGGNSARSRLSLIKGCVNSAVGRNFLDKTVAIGGFELCKSPVFKDKSYNFVVLGKSLQNVCICGIACFGLFLCRDCKVVKKHFSELFR